MPTDEDTPARDADAPESQEGDQTGKAAAPDASEVAELPGTTKAAEVSATSESTKGASDAKATSASAVPTATDTPKSTSKHPLFKRIAIGLVALVVLVAVIFAAVVYVARSFTEQEHAVRSDWSVETGDMLSSDEELSLSIYESSATSEELRIIQVVPTEIEDEGFTYYDEEVQDRLATGIADIKESAEWTADAPLAILNPFGTGSNGLYLYFETDFATQITYTVHVDEEGIEDFTATAQNVFLDEDVAADQGDSAYTRIHEFQLIGLVPGKTNEVTITVTGSWGNTRQQVTFTVDMPETQSGYSTQLEYEDGESTQELSDGLYSLVRTNGYLGYGFFFDNNGTMRYEMVTEGLGLDRILEFDGHIVVCASSNKLARIDGLGRVVQTYELGEYILHHDINYSWDDASVLALVEREGSETVEDIVIEVDLVTGEISELVDFTELMADYVEGWTRVISATDPFFWQVGERDWIHLNTVQYMEDDDSIIVSSRETSTIIKVSDVHTDPQVTYLIGEEEFWEDTPYEDLTLEQVGDFTPQYGQHTVEYDGEGPTENSYYLLMFDNNYWAISTRDDYEPDLEGTTVSTDLYSGETSHVYRYLVDEEAGTFELVASFDVPYSSIVSNVAHTPSDSTNYVVNSGVANVFGEYDEDGTLIRQFAYEAELQSYRAFKNDFVGFWFMEN